MSENATAYPPEPLLLDRYRVEGALGEGGLGTVIRAYDTRLKITRAIKTLRRDILTNDPARSQSLEERFAREAEAGARIGNHPNIVAVYDLVIAPDRTLYLILEYIAGGTLADRLKAGPIPRADALRFTTDAAKGLGAAHRAGIVHRDVKPANLFLATDGRVQVGDFGIAQIDDISGRTHTTMGHPGTPLYMAPEQSNSTGYMRPTADQYSLGLVLFEMLTGTAYKRLGARELASTLGTLSPPVATVIERMTALDADNRYPDMDAVIAALVAVNADADTHDFSDAKTRRAEVLPRADAVAAVTGRLGSAQEGQGEPTTPPAPPAISRRAVLIGIGGVVVAAGGIGGMIASARRASAPVATATATAIMQTGGTLAFAATPTTVVVAIAGSATATGTAITTALPASVAVAPSSVPATPVPVPLTATSAPVPPTPVPAPSTTAVPPAPPTSVPPIPVPPTLVPPPATVAPPTATPLPPPTATAVPPTATPLPPPTATPPSLLRPGTVVVPTAFPAVIDRVQARFGDLPDGTSVTFTDIATNDSAVLDGDRVVPAAALIDIFVIAEAYRQVEAKTLSLDMTVSIPKTPAGGTGLLQRRPGGTTTVGEMITLIAAESDNVAANLLMDQVGMDNVNRTIRVLGLTNTQLRRHLADEAARKRGIENTTTAKDMALFFTLIVRGQVSTPYVSTSLITTMGQQRKPEWDYLGGSIMPRPQIVHMPGQLPPGNGDPGVLHDVGIVYYGENDAYVLAFLNQSTLPNVSVATRAGQFSADVYRIVTGK